ncbi:hypothetical protein GCM10025868_33310 [Angustibacter aerolatus]|uniref:Alpha-D-phosphohexomutase alpha/beta/alpha domain-containing protein n=1 Tax=Angustibacter aerolatus TaxID=1162965 RepID=A0ABQ6JKJ7_9ACTN|nr:hypothetical protein GCM10025868_33310 [Angustibacter aerolatus]
MAHVLQALPGRLDGLHVVVDCAHGAASVVSPRLLREAGAEVTVIGASPDGWNINDGYGSTHLGNLQQAVVQHGADLGLAVDGDADRCLAVDADGEVVDGDQIMAVLALALREAGEPAGRHARRHRDVEPRPAAGDGARGRPRAADRRRRPLRARADAGRRLRHGRRAVRARHPQRARHHRRRRAHRSAAGRPDVDDRALARRAWPASWRSCRRSW